MIKQKLAVILIAVFLLSIVPLKTYNAAVKASIPKIKFVSSPVTEYSVGDRIKFDIYAPNYSGKIEYRVVLWDDNKKSYRDLWNENNGYPARYYTKWRPTGTSTFNLGWIINEPGSYRITVYVKRVGVPGYKAAIPRANCDSYMESVAFRVKPKETITNEQSIPVPSGTDNSPKLEIIKGSVNITEKDTVLKNAQVQGDVYILSDNATLENINIDGTLFINPGKDGGAKLNNISAKKIEILSGNEEGYELEYVKAPLLEIKSEELFMISGLEGTRFDKTNIYNDTALYSWRQNFGEVFIKDNGLEVINVGLLGDFYYPITAETDAIIETLDDSTMPPIKILPSGVEAIYLGLDGNFRNVEVRKSAIIELAENSYISTLDNSGTTIINLNKNSRIWHLDNHVGITPVIVSGEGKIEVEGANINYIIDKSELPKDSEIDSTGHYEAHFGYKTGYDGIYDLRGSRKPVFKLKLIKDNGLPPETDQNEYAFESYDDSVFKHRFGNFDPIYSIDVNEDDGTLALSGGDYKVFIPLKGGKWYMFKFTTKQIGDQGEERSEIISINDKPYTYVRWKPEVYNVGKDYLTLGSPVSEVLRIQGKPFLIDGGDGYYSTGYYYSKDNKYYGLNTSCIVLKRQNGELVVSGWRNMGDLKVSIGDAQPGAPPFTLGSSKDEVIKAIGTPSSIESNELSDVWHYPKGSFVKFRDNRLVLYKNKGDIKVDMGQKDSGAPPIKLGSTKEDVIKAMGTPDEIGFINANDLREEWWGYGESIIYFNKITNRVDAFENKGNLNLSLGESDINAPFFNLNSSTEEVVKAMGTPLAVRVYFGGESEWDYGKINYKYSTVRFNNQGKVIEYSNAGNLRVSLGEKDELAHPVQVGFTKEQVVKALGTPIRVTYSKWDYEGYSVDFNSENKVRYIQITN